MAKGAKCGRFGQQRMQLGLRQDQAGRPGCAIRSSRHQQPVTRPQIDSIRGVNSDGMMKSLLNKGLILESGRADGPGRPILYSTTPEFLQHFGLNSILEMPPLAKLEEEGEMTQNEMLKG